MLVVDLSNEKYTYTSSLLLATCFFTLPSKNTVCAGGSLLMTSPGPILCCQCVASLSNKSPHTRTLFAAMQPYINKQPAQNVFTASKFQPSFKKSARKNYPGGSYEQFVGGCV